MAKSYWLINSNRSEVRRFIKNDKSIDGIFEYMFIDSGKIVGVLGKNPPVITTTVCVDIDLAREIYNIFFGIYSGASSKCFIYLLFLFHHKSIGFLLKQYPNIVYSKKSNFCNL